MVSVYSINEKIKARVESIKINIANEERYKYKHGPIGAKHNE